MKGNGDSNNNPLLMFIFGAIFTLAGLIILPLSIIKSMEVWVTIIAGVLLVAGIIILVAAVLRTIVIKAYNQVLNDQNAFITQAEFVSAKFSNYTSTTVGVGNVEIPTKLNVYKKIIYTYTDEHGEQRTVKSILSYTPNQVEYLQNKGTFKIKCQGNISAIIEELPAMNSRYNV